MTYRKSVQNIYKFVQYHVVLQYLHSQTNKADNDKQYSLR